jgi:hypothetical protein
MGQIAAPPAIGLEDRLQIIELYHRYALAYDEVDRDLLAQCFVPDAQFVCGVRDHPLLTSFEEIADRMEARRRHKQFRERHITTNIVILDVDGDRADTTAEAAIFQTPEGGRSELEMTGRYVDQLIKRDGAWFFAARSFLTDGEPRRIL